MRVTCQFSVNHVVWTSWSMIVPGSWPMTAGMSQLLLKCSSVFFRNPHTLGLSLVPPLCLWHSKNTSRGSRVLTDVLVQKDKLFSFTSGTENRYLTRWMNELAKTKKSNW